jgi:uncharacterized protein
MLISKKISLLAIVAITACAHSPQVAAQHAEEPSRALSPAEKKALLERSAATYDKKRGFAGEERIDTTSTELAMVAASEGLSRCAGMAQKTLLKNLKLVARQIENENEAPLADLAETLRLYAIASAMWRSQAYADAAQAISVHLETQLTSPDGAFLSGGSDEIVTGDNGLTIMALATLHDATGDEEALARAIRAAEWLIEQRKIGSAGFRAGEDKGAQPRLSDTLAMGQAMLKLYASTADERWLGEAEDAAFFIGSTFADEERGGFYTMVPMPENEQTEKKIDENIRVARFANLLSRYTGKDVLRKMAEHALVYLGEAQEDGFVAGILIADLEIRREPLHVIVVGKKDDPRAKALHRAALRRAASYQVVEWVEPGPAPLRAPFANYPRPSRPAAIACAEDDCTPPAFQPEQVQASLALIAGR